ncbi:hypothetical protein ACFXG4_49610 [Nocardia sp. NPDC059246]|uniref:hypothetical protein n=1 Tax=unclassified Nocardia TaxID=2637762 RepID=UPI00367AE25A
MVRERRAKFRDIAREFGLTVDRDRGWTVTIVPDVTADAYQRQIRKLDAAIIAYRRDEHEPAEGEGEDGEDGDKSGKAPRNGRALVRISTPARRVRAAQKTIDAGPILCGACREPFTAATADED